MAQASPGRPPPLPAPPAQALAPVVGTERIATLDILRGFALLGVLISNMVYFSNPLEESAFRNSLWLAPGDRLADWISLIFIEGKFYPLFSFLFGLGFSIQMARAASRGLDFRATYRRRLSILMRFGLAHGILLWDGDVLFLYAVCGFALLLFRDRKPLTLSLWAAALILLPALVFFALSLLTKTLSGHPEAAGILQEALARDPVHYADLSRAYVTGSYLDAVSHRAGELLITIPVGLFFGTGYLGFFLLGLLAGRKRIITDPAPHRRLLVLILIFSAPLGLAGNFLGASSIMMASTQADYASLMNGVGILTLSGPVLTAAYIAGLVLLIAQRPRFPMVPAFAAVGQMALTNYLTQSLIATTLFYGYGLGLGGTIGRLGTIGIALSIFLIQMCYSRVWLHYFRFGPMEWLWRSLTYGVKQPMIRRKAAAETSALP